MEIKMTVQNQNAKIHQNKNYLKNKLAKVSFTDFN